MILLRHVPNVVEIRYGWKLYIVAGGVMVRILLNETAQRENFSRWSVSFSNVLNITPPATIYSFQPSLISTTLGTDLSRIMIDSRMIAF
jgi:hypothetical protein